MRFQHLAAGAFAGLATLAAAQDVYVTDTDVVYATAVVYVDSNGNPVTESDTAPATTTSTTSRRSKHRHGHSTYTQTSSATTTAVTTTATPVSTLEAVVTTIPTTTSSYVAPVTITTTPIPIPTTFQTTTSAAAATTAASGGCADPSTIYAAAADLCDGASDADYCQRALGATNVHRSNHTAAPLRWNATLEAWAKTHADQCVFQDYLIDDGTYHQSNAFAGFGQAGDAEAATNTWYNTEECLFNQAGLYGVANPPADVSGQEIGHFTNVVWKGWTSMGCATTLCGETAGMTNANLTLCFYSVYGEFFNRCFSIFKDPFTNCFVQISLPRVSRRT